VKTTPKPSATKNKRGELVGPPPPPPPPLFPPVGVGAAGAVDAAVVDMLWVKRQAQAGMMFRDV
jgi:hypothetical protein